MAASSMPMQTGQKRCQGNEQVPARGWARDAEPSLGGENLSAVKEEFPHCFTDKNATRDFPAGISPPAHA